MNTHWILTGTLALMLPLVTLAHEPTSQISEWDQTGGPLGGIISKMLTVNGNPIAAMYSGGIYRFTNDHWQQIGINNGLPENRAFDIVVDPENPNVIFSGMMIACGARSLDGGNSWESLCDGILAITGADNFSSDTLVFDPSDTQSLYVFGRASDSVRYVLHSPDQGDTWEIITTFDEEYYFNHAVFFNNILYVGLQSGGIITSEDLGETWSDLNTGLTDDGVIRFASDGETLYVAGGLFRFNVRAGGSLYRLDTNANAWEIIDGVDEVTSIAMIDDVLWIGTYDGEVWKKSGNSLTHMNINNPFSEYISEFAKDASGNIFMGVNGYGIYQSEDNGTSWGKNNSGLKSMALREIAVHPTKSKRLYALTWDRFGLFYSKNAGDSYSVIAPDNYFLTMGVDPADFKHLYAGGPNIFYEITLKKNKAVVTERTAPGPDSAEVQAIAVHPKKPKNVLVGMAERVESTEGYGIYRSTNSGQTWKKVKSIPNNGVYSIAYHPTNPKVVYAAVFGKGVYKSTNAGKTFKKIGNTDLKYTYRIAIHPKKPKNILASSHLFFAGLSTEDQISGQYGGIFKTENGGASWNEVTADIRVYDDDDSVSDEDFELWKYNFGHLPNYEQILFDPKDPDTYIVGHHGENVVITTDDGVTWNKPVNGMISGDMHNYAYCLGAAKDFKKIYSCTCGRGIFSGQFSRITETLNWDNPNIASAIPTESIIHTSQAARALIMSDDGVHDHTPLELQ